MVCQGRQGTIDNIVISFTNEVLYNKDRKLYKGLQQVFEGRTAIHLVHGKEGLKGLVTAKTLVIQDEADEAWIDEEGEIPGASCVLGLSATTYRDPEATEAKYLSEVGVKIIDSNLFSENAETLPVAEVFSYEEFFLLKGKFGNPGFLIYARED